MFRTKPDRTLLAAIGLFLCLSLFLIWRLMPRDLLTGDEVFYYFQALKLRSFELAWFRDTSPYLYPLVLALSGSSSPAVLRTLGALLFALSGYLTFNLTLLLSGGDREGAFWAAGLLLFFHETLNLSTQLFTEAAFTPVFLALILVFWRQRGNKASGTGAAVMLGLLAGLLTGARVVGVLCAGWIFLYRLLWPGGEDRRQALRSVCLSVLTAAALHVPFFLATYSPDSLISCMLGAHTKESLFAHPPGGLLAHFVPWLTGGYSVCALGLAAAWPLRREQGARFLLGLGAVYLAFEALLDVNFYPRHLYPLFVLACVLIGCSYRRLSLIFPRWGLRAVAAALMVMSSAAFAAGFPKLSPNNFYFLNGTADAIEIARFSQTDETGGVKEVTLPCFSQPYYSHYTYRAAFYCTGSYDHIFINYISDRIKVRADGRELTPGFTGGPFYPLVLSCPFPPGRHELEIQVDSDVMLNGLGQVLIVNGDFLRRNPG